MTSDDQWIDLAVEAGQLREAMATRPQIDVAKGIIMGARRCSADDAFAEMKRLSSHHNIKVAELSRALVRLVELPPGTPADEQPDAVDAVAAAWLRDLGVPPATG